MDREWFDLSNADNIYNNIVLKLIGNQNIAKCLKFSSPDALTQTDLTQDEQYALVKQTNIDTCRIFNIPPTYYVTKEQRAEIRVYESAIVSSNPHIYEVCYCFDLVCHQELWILEDGSRRVMQLANNIVKELNGIDVGGMGKMRFFSERKPEIFRVQFYNDVVAGYKLFGFLTTGGADVREC